MPLVQSGSDAAISENIRRERAAGKPQRQAVAIAMDVARRARRRRRVRKAMLFEEALQKYSAKQPRKPAGSPGGHGGEFASTRGGGGRNAVAGKPLLSINGVPIYAKGTSYDTAKVAASMKAGFYVIGGKKVYIAGWIHDNDDFSHRVVPIMKGKDGNLYAWRRSHITDELWRIGKGKDGEFAFAHSYNGHHRDVVDVNHGEYIFKHDVGFGNMGMTMTGDVYNSGASARGVLARIVGTGKFGLFIDEHDPKPVLEGFKAMHEVWKGFLGGSVIETEKHIQRLKEAYGYAARNAVREMAHKVLDNSKHVTQEQWAALNDYAGSAYTEINRALRNGHETYQVPLLDRAIAPARLSKAVVVYRAVSARPERMKVGFILQHHNYASTSTDYRTARGFGNFVMRTRLKKGFKALAYNSAEGEILLPRGYGFKVSKITKRKDDEYESESYDVDVTLVKLKAAAKPKRRGLRKADLSKRSGHYRFCSYDDDFTVVTDDSDYEEVKPERKATMLVDLLKSDPGVGDVHVPTAPQPKKHRRRKARTFAELVVIKGLNPPKSPLHNEGYALWRDLHEEVEKYDARQPRAPKGTANAGQWIPRGAATAKAAALFGAKGRDWQQDVADGVTMRVVSRGTGGEVGAQAKHIASILREHPAEVAARFGNSLKAHGFSHVVVTFYGATHAGSIRFDVNAVKTGRHTGAAGFASPDFTMNRIIFPDKKEMSFDAFYLGEHLQGTGIAKTVLRDCMVIARRSGMEKAGIIAAQVGAYAWAKYGFTPESGSWDRLRSDMKAHLGRLRVSGKKRTALAALIESPDSRSIWKLVDEHPKEAKTLLMNRAWTGYFDFSDKAAMRRLRRYTAAGKLVRKALLFNDLIGDDDHANS